MAWEWFPFVVGGLTGMLATWVVMLGALYLEHKQDDGGTASW